MGGSLQSPKNFGNYNCRRTGGLIVADQADLRSRCQLFPTQKFVWELLDTPGESPKQYELSGEEAIALFEEAVKSLKTANLPWNDEIILTPSAELIHLVAKSQDLAMSQATEGGK